MQLKLLHHSKSAVHPSLGSTSGSWDVLFYSMWSLTPQLTWALPSSCRQVRRPCGHSFMEQRLQKPQFFGTPLQLFTIIVPEMAPLAIDRTSCQLWWRSKDVGQQYCKVEAINWAAFLLWQQSIKDSPEKTERGQNQEHGDLSNEDSAVPMLKVM